MNGKAIIVQSLDYPTAENLRFSFNVSFFSLQGFVATENMDVSFDSADTVTQMKTKVRNAIIARGAELGLTITTTNVGSIMQI